MSKRKLPPVDFQMIDHGTVWTIIAKSDAAKEFANENLAVEDWMGSPEKFTTDWRPARNLAQSLEGEGFVIGY